MRGGKVTASKDRQDNDADANCEYGECRIAFRGPASPIDEPFVAVIGASEVRGDADAAPFTERLAALTGRTVVNFGVANAGIDVFVRDPAFAAVASRADVVVMEAMGAHNLSNRFYTVHPRRNDRFIKASKRLGALYPDVDFTNFTFTRHMLTTLRARCERRFESVMQELERAWMARMRLFLRSLPADSVILDLREEEELDVRFTPVPHPARDGRRPSGVGRGRGGRPPVRPGGAAADGADETDAEAFRERIAHALAAPILSSPRRIGTPRAALPDDGSPLRAQDGGSTADATIVSVKPCGSCRPVSRHP